MKKTKLLFTLFIISAVTALFPAVVFCDLVDDMCAEFGWTYRWTIETVLDDSYKGSVPYEEISDDGRLQISFIHFETPVEIETARKTRLVEECVVLSGKTEVACSASASSQSYINYSTAYVKDNDMWKIVTYDNELHPLNYAMNDYDENQWHHSDLMMQWLRYRTDTTKTCVIIGELTPIYMDDKFLRKIEDTNMTFTNRRGGAFFSHRVQKLPVKYDTLPVKSVIRPDKKSPPVPDDINIYEQNYVMPIDFAYDREKVFSGETNDKLIKRSNNVGKYDIFIKEGGTKNTYIVSNHEGDAVFDVEIPIDKMEEKTRKIAPDGKVRVTLSMYKKAAFNVKEPMSIPNVSYSYLIKLEGSEGEGYAGSNIPKEEEGGYIWRKALFPMDDYDGNAGLYMPKYHNYEYKNVKGGSVPEFGYPYICVKYDEETGALTNMGLSYVTEVKDEKHIYEDYMCDIKDIKINECVEHELVKIHLGNSSYLATPVVEKARADRNAVEYNPDIMFIPVPTEPQGEAVLHPELPLAPKEGDIRITVGGKEIAFDVAPQIEEDRVLVPLRAVFEQLGDFVDWNEETKTAKIIGGDITIEFVIGNIEVKVNGEEKQMDIPAKILNGRTLVPMRFLSEALGYQVNWNEEARIVSVDKL